MWLWLSLTALLCWSGSDLFSKIGCRDGSDRYSHLKMVIAVGVVMGLHAAFEIFVGGTAISWSVIWTYLPVSLLYISSMALGYLGLRYIELSVSSPICNSSGALVAVLTLLFVGGEDYSPLALLAIALVCTGAIGLGVVDATEDPELRLERQKASNYKYAKSFLALALPAAYCLLDAAGTFADNRVLEILTDRYMNAGMFATLRECADQAAASANCAYELTFLAAAAFCFIYVVVIKKDRLVPKMEAPKYFGAICETAGQFAYIYAISDTAHLAMSAPIISSYCAASARRALGADHLGLLRGIRPLEPDLPEGKALLEALYYDLSGGHRHRHHGLLRPVSPLYMTTPRRSHERRGSFSGTFRCGFKRGVRPDPAFPEKRPAGIRRRSRAATPLPRPRCHTGWERSPVWRPPRCPRSRGRLRRNGFAAAR